MYKHIFLPYDGSALSDKALEHGIALASSSGSKITLFYVLRPYHLQFGTERIAPGLKQLEQQHMAALEAKASEMLQAALQKATAAKVMCDMAMEQGTDPHENIIAGAARLQCDLILMASHGRRGLESVLLGSETHKVLTRSTIPVLVLR